MNQTGITSEELRERIDNYFKNKNTNDNVNKKHEIGEIAVIEQNNVIYYLLAISIFDKNNRSVSTKNDIEKAIRSLLVFYDLYGQGIPMYMPLVGTGRSRAGLDYNDSIIMIVDNINSNCDLVQGRISIAVKKDVDFDI